MPAQSSPYQGSQGFHRPRPSISHAASTPAGFTTSGRSEDSTTTTTKTATAGLPVKNVQNVNTKPLPSRPANHLQQQHNAYSKSYESPRLNQTHFDDSLPKTQVGPLPDEDEEILRTSTRPPLTSKFSFDNLTAMGEGAIESGGAFKRMVTK